jgi:hypothetical protein
MKLTIHPRLVLKSRIIHLYLHSPTRLQCVMLIQLNTGITLTFIIIYTLTKRRDSAVNIATGYGLEGRASEFDSVEERNLHFSVRSRSALKSTQSYIQKVVNAIFPGIKRSGREAENSSPTSTKINLTYIYISNTPHVFKP